MLRSIHIPRRFVSHSWGGTETVVLETLKRLNALGHPASIFTSCALATEERSHRANIEGVEVHRFSHFYPYLGLSDRQCHRLDQCGGNLFSWPLLKALTEQKEAGILHLHTGKRMGGIARTVARLKRIPYVLSLHGGLLARPASETRRQEGKTRGALEWGKALGWLVGSRKVLEQASVVLCLSEAERQALLSRYPTLNCRVLPNGVDLERFKSGQGHRFRAQHGIAPEAKVLAVIGRVDPQKGQCLAVRALSRLEDRSVHLLLVGPATDGAYEQELETEIEQRQLGARVTRVGGLSGRELVDAYHSCDLLLVPSAHEPFGIVALEGWASGKPVLASRTGGLQELIAEGRNGMLFRPGDEEELAARIARVLAEPRIGQQLSTEGLRTVASYSWTEHTRKLLEIYQEAIHDYSIRQ